MRPNYSRFSLVACAVAAAIGFAGQASADVAEEEPSIVGVWQAQQDFAEGRVAMQVKFTSSGVYWLEVYYRDQLIVERDGGYRFERSDQRHEATLILSFPGSCVLADEPLTFLDATSFRFRSGQSIAGADLSSYVFHRVR